jgi:hypothetical protein
MGEMKKLVLNSLIFKHIRLLISISSYKQSFTFFRRNIDSRCKFDDSHFFKKIKAKKKLILPCYFHSKIDTIYSIINFQTDLSLFQTKISRYDPHGTSQRNSI